MDVLLKVVLAIFIIVVSAEVLWRNKILRSEPSRKLVHILVGTYVASWGFFLADQQILLLAAAMFGVVLASRYLGVLGSIHNVQRKTWGELFFPIGIASCAVLTGSPWIFMAAMLHVSVADGLAAVVGSNYIKKHGYKIFNQQKTIVGSLIFFNASIFITLAATLLAPELQGSVLVVLIVPLLSLAAENIAVYGADDLFVPVVVVLVMNALAI
jgi:phytol kinase